MKHRLAIIDDEEFGAIHIQGVLGDRYECVCATTGQAGVNLVTETLPDLVLMDVEMPGMDGYTACRRLKETQATRDIPVLFLSAHSDEEDRLRGYGAGGDDYISKPFNPEELLRKIELTLRQRARNQELSSRVKSATQAARDAMLSMSDISLALHFLRQVVGSTDQAHIATTALEALSNFDLEAAIQLRDRSGAVSRSTQGLCSPLEESILTHMAKAPRNVDLGARSAFNYERASIIINNMPRDDAAKCARIKDLAQLIAEAADIHMKSLDVVLETIDRGDALLRLVQGNAETMRNIGNHLAAQREESTRILNQLVKEIEDAFYWMGLSDKQEAFLQERTRNAIDATQALYDNWGETDAIMKSLSEGLDGALQQEIRGAADASGATSRVEVW